MCCNFQCISLTLLLLSLHLNLLLLSDAVVNGIDPSSWHLPHCSSQLFLPVFLPLSIHSLSLRNQIPRLVGTVCVMIIRTFRRRAGGHPRGERAWTTSLPVGVALAASHFRGDGLHSVSEPGLWWVQGLLLPPVSSESLDQRSYNSLVPLI